MPICSTCPQKMILTHLSLMCYEYVPIFAEKTEVVGTHASEVWHIPSLITNHPQADQRYHFLDGLYCMSWTAIARQAGDDAKDIGTSPRSKSSGYFKGNTTISPMGLSWRLILRCL